MKLNKVNLGLGGGSLLQVANRTLTQMMSYVIDTPEGGCIVIDGGNYLPEDANNLYAVLSERNKKVDLWIITHAHSDHVGTLVWMLENYQPFDIKIEKLCFNFPEEEWLNKREDWEINKKFLDLIKKHKFNVITPQAGDLFEVGKISAEIISVPEDYEKYPSINPTSIVTVIHFPQKDVLFLSDFDTLAQAEFLKKHDPLLIRKDIVQMAHHGQNGVDFEFYKLIQPKICLYPAPQWLWENNNYRCTDPKTAGKGPFMTLETRKWMEELGVRQSFTQAEGDYLFF